MHELEGGVRSSGVLQRGDRAPELRITFYNILKDQQPILRSIMATDSHWAG